MADSGTISITLLRGESVASAASRWREIGQSYVCLSVGTDLFEEWHPFAVSERQTNTV